MPALLLICITSFSQEERPTITGIEWVTLPSTNLQRSAVFYRDLLGFKLHWHNHDDDSLFSFDLNEGQRVTILRSMNKRDLENKSRQFTLRFAAMDFPHWKSYMGSRWFYTRTASVDRHKDLPAYYTVDRDKHVIWFIPPAASDSERTHDTLSAGAISSRIAHVGLSIRDTVKADRFYRKALGFQEIGRSGPESGFIWIDLKVPGGTDCSEYVLVPKKPTNTQVGLANHLALTVSDARAAADRLKKRMADVGYRSEMPPLFPEKIRQFNLLDPDGTLIEFVEP